MKKLVARGAAALVLVFAFVLVAIAVQHRLLARRLVDEVNRLSANRPRPVHRGPAREGTFEGCVGPLLDRAPNAVAFVVLKDQAREAVYGAAPIDATLRAETERLLPWAREVVACSAAGALGEAPGLGPFADWDHARQSGELLYGSTVPRIVQLGILIDSEQGRHGGVQACADVLAYARDVARDKGLIGAMQGVATTRGSAAPCAKALDGADDDARRAFLSELAVVRSSTPPFREILEIERAEAQILGFGRNLWSSDLDQLPANARALTGNALFSDSRRAQAMAWFYWNTYVRKMDRYIDASESSTRDEVFASVDAESDLLAEELGATPSSFLSFARRYDAVDLTYDLIESAAHVKLGEPPLPRVTRSIDGGTTTLSVPWGDSTAQVTVTAE